MKTTITTWPIDRSFQEKLGIYHSSYVKSISVGKILHKLINAGYTELNSFVENRQDDETKENESILVFHCKAGQTLLDKIRDESNKRRQAFSNVLAKANA